MAGVHVDMWAAASIAKAFDKLGIAYGRTPKGSPSFTKGFLSTHPHPLARLIVEARELNKASGTFISKLLDCSSSDGRVHAHINQIRGDDGGTVSGRFSYNNPNLQQIPARNQNIGPRIRGLFLPDEGEQWASLDFSQQEPRLAVHYASRLKLNLGQIKPLRPTAMIPTQTFIRPWLTWQTSSASRPRQSGLAGCTAWARQRWP
jgi:hypothetical protein